MDNGRYQEQAMFLFFRKRNFIAISIPCLIIIAAFSGCELYEKIPESDSYPISDDLRRVWEFHDPVDSTKDRYIAITGTDYTEYNPSRLDGTTDITGDSINSGKDAIIAVGTIEEITDTDSPSGYIYVKTGDNYFAVRWENYAGTSVRLRSTRNDSGGIQSSLAAAKTAYDDAYDSNWQHLVTYNKAEILIGGLKGEWSGTGAGNGSTVEITDVIYTDSYAGDVTYSGIIVETTDPAQDEGYIYIKYVKASFGKANNYYAIHWENRTANSIDMSGSSHGRGQSSLEKAKDEYTKSNGFFRAHTTFVPRHLNE
jgi:hypothetical protein